MKMIKATVFILAAICLSTAVKAQTESGTQQLVVPLSEPGKPFKLNVGLINGSIRVLTHEGKDIVIDIEADNEGRKKNESGNRNENNGGMRRINPSGGMDVTAEEKNNKVTINTESWKRGSLLVIKVPQTEATLKLSTVNNGEISVTNVSGEMEISNTNGAITLKNISGSVVANTVNGPINASFKSVDPKAAMAFSTLNGNVDVTFPASFKANVKLQSDRGNMYTDFDLEADKAQPKVNRTSQAGFYRINVESWVYGKINGGGPELMMKNMNGNIYIRKAK